MICCFLIFLAWSAFKAAGLGSKVTDADYYSKGLKYNTTMVEKRAAEVLGWKLSTRLEGRLLEFHVVDSSGSVVDKAAGTLYLAIPGTAENVRLPLEEVVAGNYRVNLGTGLTGSIQARLELERQGARLNRHLLLNL
jgi:nitrogen fixation protein FixH